MTRISPPRTRTFSSPGFTLIEVLITVSLIAMVMTLVIPSLGNALKMSLSSSTRELATVIHSAHDEAVLKGQVYRMAFDIENRQYWVEIGDRDYLMRTQEQEAEERKRQEHRNEEEKAKHKEPFSMAHAVTKKKITLPKGVKFSDIVTARSKEPAKTGTVYAHVFPHGFTEKLIIHLKDSYEREATLVVSPVTGKSRYFERYVTETD